MSNLDRGPVGASERRTINDCEYRELEKALFPAIEGTAKALARGDRDFQDDINSAGRLALLHVLERFNPHLGVPLIPFALRHVRLRQLDAYREEKRATDRFVPFSDLAVGCSENSSQCDVIDALLHRFSAPGSELGETLPIEWNDRAEAVDSFITTLPLGLRGIADRLYREGFNQAEVAREFRVSRTAVGKALKRVHAYARTSRTLAPFRGAA